MGLIKYGMRAFYRNKGRTLGIAVGVVIAITLFSGANIATDSLLSYKVLKGLDGVIVDLRATGPAWNSGELDDPAEVLDLFRSIQAEYAQIQTIIPLLCHFAQEEVVLNATGPIVWESAVFENRSMLVGLDGEVLQNSRLQGMVNITKGSFPAVNRSILLDELTARRHGVSVGDNLSLGVISFGAIPFYKRDITNLTIAGLFTIQDPTRLQGLLGTGYTVQDGQATILANFTTMHSIIDFLVPGYPLEGRLVTTYNFLIDHASFDAGDLASGKARLKQIEDAITAARGSFSYFVESHLYLAITEQENAIGEVRSLLLILTLPALMLGWYLTQSLYNQILERRAGEIGQLKSKGATKRQISSWFLLEASILGGMGGLVGYFGGYASANLFLMAQLQAEYPTFSSANLLHGSVFSFFFAVALAIGMCIASAAGPIRRLNQLPVVDVTKGRLNYATHDPWKSKYDVPALILGIVPILWMIIFTDQVVSMLPSNIIPIIMTVTAISMGLNLVAPFFLAYGVIKVVSGHSPTRLAAIAKGLGALMSRKHAWLIGRNVGGRPKQSGGLVFILALTVCLGFVIGIVKTSQQAFLRETTYIKYGADLRIDAYSSLVDTLLLKDELAGFSPDIAQVTMTGSVLPDTFKISQIFPDISVFPERLLICGLNATNYLDVVYFKTEYVASNDPAALFTNLASTPNGTLLLESWAAANGYQEGDTFTVAKTPLKIVGFFTVMPGYEDAAMVINFDDFISSFTSTDFSLPSYKLLAKMIPLPLVNGTQIAKNIQFHFRSRIYEVYSLEEEIATLETSGIGLVLDSLDIQYVFTIVIATAGVSIFIFRSFSERRREIATLRARGMSFGEVFKLQSGEGTTLVLLGVLLGLVGIPIAYTLNIQFGFVYGYNSPISPPFIVPESLFWQLGIMFVTLVVLVWLTSWLEVRRTAIPEIANALRVY